LFDIFIKKHIYILMNAVFVIAAILACLSVLGAMGLGLFSMVKGGDFNKQHGNKLMQARVMLQGLALAMLALAYFSAQN